MHYLAQTVADPISGALLQYGALGVICLGMFLVIRTQDRRSTADREATFKRLSEEADAERARADRLEDELRKLNASVRDDYVKPLIDTARVMSDVLVALRGDKSRDRS